MQPITTVNPLHRNISRAALAIVDSVVNGYTSVSNSDLRVILRDAIELAYVSEDTYGLKYLARVLEGAAAAARESIIQAEARSAAAAKA